VYKREDVFPPFAFLHPLLPLTTITTTTQCFIILSCLKLVPPLLRIG
jgi:hypothetical protein